MTTSVYWAEIENAEGSDTLLTWAEIEHQSQPAVLYWAEIEQADVDAASSSGDLPEITAVVLSGGATTSVSGTVDMTATVTDQDGDPIKNVSGTVASTDDGVATVTLLAPTDASGQATVRATGVAGGETLVTIGVDTLQSAPETVQVIEVDSVVVALPVVSLEVGTTGVATVTVLDQNGDPMQGLTVDWTSSGTSVIADPANGTTGYDGKANVPLPALTAGTTNIGATVGGVSATPVLVTVTAVAEAPGYSATGSARVVINCVSVVKRMGRSQPRRFSDADQRKRDPTDTAFSRVKDTQEKQIVWPSRELMKRYL